MDSHDLTQYEEPDVVVLGSLESLTEGSSVAGTQADVGGSSDP